ncbi:MAG: hypothetical protein HQL15_02685 [Candidatus Omnitrophica bacterium]|nr:hypothetical protein [Candidatus Omnitrophota bacterium]
MKKSPFVHILILTAFLFNSFGLVPTVQAELVLPKPGTMVHLSPEFNLPILKGIKVHKDNPFRFEFVLDQGDRTSAEAKRESILAKEDYLKTESTKLIKYFLASLTTPEKDMWVNLSPYEKDRIVPESFGQTEMGRDLLAQDYILKQITASLIYPEEETGKKFWKRVYEEAAKKFGTTNIPVNTFNKVWIVPEKAVIYENAKVGAAYVVEARLKVMLEEDYVALERNNKGRTSPQGIPIEKDSETIVLQEKAINSHILGSQIIREIVIPELTREVNEGKNFAQLRQVYYSFLLASWYKKKIKNSILSAAYADQNKTDGVRIKDPKENQKIYEQYLQAFKKGVYNYIKETPDSVSGQSFPRKYFSGGTQLIYSVKEVENSAVLAKIDAVSLVQVKASVDFAQTTREDNPMLDDLPFWNTKDENRRFLRLLANEGGRSLEQAIDDHGVLLRTVQDQDKAYEEYYIDVTPVGGKPIDIQLKINIENAELERLSIIWGGEVNLLFRQEYSDKLLSACLKLANEIYTKKHQGKGHLIFDWINIQRAHGSNEAPLLGTDRQDWAMKSFSLDDKVQVWEDFVREGQTFPENLLHEQSQIVLYSFEQEIETRLEELKKSFAKDSTEGVWELLSQDVRFREAARHDSFLRNFYVKEPSQLFRYEYTYEFLFSKMFPLIVKSLVNGKPLKDIPPQVINVGVIGAAYGEEPISVVILCDQMLKKMGLQKYVKVRIHVMSPQGDVFKKVKNNQIIYPSSIIESHVDKEFPKADLSEYFVEEKGHYKRSSTLDQMISFYDFNFLDETTHKGIPQFNMLLMHNVIQYLIPQDKENLNIFKNKVNLAWKYLDQLLKEGSIFSIFNGDNLWDSHVKDSFQKEFMFSGVYNSMPPSPDRWMLFKTITDAAMNSSLKDQAMQITNGGIDLTSDKTLQIQNSGQGFEFKIDPAQLSMLRNASGLVPIVIDIQPISDLLLFFSGNGQLIVTPFLPKINLPRE